MMDAEHLQNTRRLATQLPVNSIRCSTAAGSGHPASSISAADLMAVMLTGHQRYDWDRPDLPTNDHLVLSNGLVRSARAAGRIRFPTAFEEVALALRRPLRGGDNHHRAPRVGDNLVADGAKHRPDESTVSVRADHHQVASADALEQHLGGVSFHRLLRDSHRIRRAVRVGFGGLADRGVQQLFHRRSYVAERRHVWPIGQREHAAQPRIASTWIVLPSKDRVDGDLACPCLAERPQ